MTVALASALNGMLTAMARGDGEGTVPVNALTLIRCLIDMDLAELRKATDE